jgi:hypothetical protein
MPSTIVHLAIAGLIAAVLLGEAFDKRSLCIILLITAIPDFDSFIALYSTIGHRTVLHNMVLPLLSAVLLWVDLEVRNRSILKTRWGNWGVRVAWVSIVCYLIAHVFVDLTDGVVNLLWPMHDQFYTLRGEMELSSKRGIVQTFTDSDGGFLLFDTAGTSQNTQLTTGVDPGDGATERMFPIAGSGLELLVTIIGTAVTVTRFWLPQELADD